MRHLVSEPKRLKKFLYTNNSVRHLVSEPQCPMLGTLECSDTKLSTRCFFLLAGLGGYDPRCYETVHWTVSCSSACALSAWHTHATFRIHHPMRKEKLTSFDVSLSFGWAGRIRTAEMPESKSGALPLGYSPICFFC